MRVELRILLKELFLGPRELHSPLASLFNPPHNHLLVFLFAEFFPVLIIGVCAFCVSRIEGVGVGNALVSVGDGSLGATG